jgi:hypothetical protein
MNERIKQLANQAGYYVDPDFDIEFEVFAKLIVRECAEVCAKQSFHYAEHNNPGSAASAADACRILIKQHFGVE